MREVTIGSSSRKVGDEWQPYFVAELNTSHFGDLNAATLLIDRAKASGANCVKFQSWSAESLYSAHFLRENPVQARMLRRLALTEQDLREIANYCLETGIDFASTPYSLQEAEVLASIPEVPFIKIASMDLVHRSFLREIAALGKPIVLSTGMSHSDEVASAVETVVNSGCNALVLLHCVSIYPTPPELVSLKNIETLRNWFPSVPVGFSDHTLSASAAVGAVALGACLIEKHLTDDRSRPGMDNQMAMEPKEFGQMIEQCVEVYESLGARERIVSDIELEQREKMQRSIVAARDLPQGHTLGEADLVLLRPGTGIPSLELEKVVGLELSEGVQEGELIRWEMLNVNLSKDQPS